MLFFQYESSPVILTKVNKRNQSCIDSWRKCSTPERNFPEHIAIEQTTPCTRRSTEVLLIMQFHANCDMISSQETPCGDGASGRVHFLIVGKTDECTILQLQKQNLSTCEVCSMCYGQCRRSQTSLFTANRPGSRYFPSYFHLWSIRR